jgi:hypothetical protein
MDAPRRATERLPGTSRVLKHGSGLRLADRGAGRSPRSRQPTAGGDAGRYEDGGREAGRDGDGGREAARYEDGEREAGRYEAGGRGALSRRRGRHARRSGSPCANESPSRRSSVFATMGQRPPGPGGFPPTPSCDAPGRGNATRGWPRDPHVRVPTDAPCCPSRRPVVQPAGGCFVYPLSRGATAGDDGRIVPPPAAEQVRARPPVPAAATPVAESPPNVPRPAAVPVPAPEGHPLLVAQGNRNRSTHGVNPPLVRKTRPARICYHKSEALY